MIVSYRGFGGLTDDAALVAVEGSGRGDVLLDDVEIDDGGLGVVDEVADAEEDLPCEEVREEGRGRGQQRVLGEERADVGSEGTGEEVVGAGAGHGF